jgi:hypothetical protein
MKLIDAISQLNSFDQESTIYASRPWAENSTAIVAREPESGNLPLEAERLGLSYFLEVFVAREFIEDWTANLNAQPTLGQSVNGSSDTPPLTPNATGTLSPQGIGKS